MTILLVLPLVAIVAVHGSQADSSVDLLKNIVNTSDFKEHEHMADSSTDVPKLRQIQYPQYKVITQEQRRLSKSRNPGIQESRNGGVNPTPIVPEEAITEKPIVDGIGNTVELGNALRSFSASRYGEAYKDDSVSQQNTRSLPLALSGHDSFGHSSIEEENTSTHKPTPLNLLMPSKHREGVFTNEPSLKEHNSEEVNTFVTREHRYAGGYETENFSAVGENDDVSVLGPEEVISIGSGASRYANGYVTRNPSVVVVNDEASEYFRTTNPSPVDTPKVMRLNQNLALALQSTTFPSTLKDYNYIGISSEKPVEEQNGESIDEKLNVKQHEEPKDYSSSFVTASENEQTHVESSAQFPTEGYLFPANLQQFPSEDIRPLLPTHSTVVDEPHDRHFMIPIQVLHTLHLSPEDHLLKVPNVVRHQSILHHVGHHLRHISDPTYEHPLLDRELNLHDIASHIDGLHRFTPQFNDGLVSEVYSHYERPPPPDTL